MINNSTAVLLKNLADRYETAEFIADDPVGAAHNTKDKRNTEITAFVSQWLAYGKREMFLKVMARISQDMGINPHQYIGNRDFERFKGDNTCLYRFYTNHDYYCICERLHNVYFNEGKGVMSMEDVLKKHLKTKGQTDCISVIRQIEELFKGVKGIPKDTASACKRLCMFLRWMVRKNSPVDYGLWDIVQAKDLIIPLDTHVFKQSRKLGLTLRNDTSMKTALEITNNLKHIFPSDPVRADFALFGLGIDEVKNKSNNKG